MKNKGCKKGCTPAFITYPGTYFLLGFYHNCGPYYFHFTCVYVKPKKALVENLRKETLPVIKRNQLTNAPIYAEILTKSDFTPIKNKKGSGAYAAALVT
jgi:hypothetical protein